jgi:hypothetical protein
MGRVQNSSVDDNDSVSGFLNRIHTLLSDARPEHRQSLITEWIRLNKANLDMISAEGQSWFLPRWCGGLGLPPPEDFTVDRVSNKHRRVLSRICRLDGQSFVDAMSLETPSSGLYVSMGMKHMGQVLDQLEHRSTLVAEYTDDWNRERETALDFVTQCARPGRTDQTLSGAFDRLAVRSRSFLPAPCLPYWARRVVRHAIPMPHMRIDWTEFWNARHRESVRDPINTATIVDSVEKRWTNQAGVSWLSTARESHSQIKERLSLNVRWSTYENCDLKIADCLGLSVYQ